MQSTPFLLESDEEVTGASWVSEFEERKRRVVEAANVAQSDLDPNGTFAALPESEKTRLTKALVRTFLFSTGASPSLPIAKPDVVTVFEVARREGSLASVQKLFPYFLAEAQKRLAEVFGLQLHQMNKRVTSEEAKKRNSKPSTMFYVTSLMPKEIRSEYMEPHEKEMVGIMGLLVRLVVAADGKLTKTEAIELLSHLGLKEKTYHATFGEWEKTIFDEALRRRWLITSRLQPGVFEVGEAAYLIMTENMPITFTNYPTE